MFVWGLVEYVEGVNVGGANGDFLGGANGALLR